MKNIDILSDEGQIDIKIIEEYSNIIGYKFPKNYIALISNHNGLYLGKRDTFRYFDEVVQKKEENGIYFYFFKENNNYELGDSSSSMVYYLMDNEDFKKGIIPFGGTGNGDYICFDYRDDFKSDNPKIVLVHHDADDDEGNLVISFLGNDFEEFMDSLYEWQDEE